MAYHLGGEDEQLLKEKVVLALAARALGDVVFGLLQTRQA